jgi:hypothetical protein
VLTRLPGEALYIPPPRRCGGKVLYLDFDGVLHPESVYLYRNRGPALLNAPGHELFEHCKRLETVLSPYPDVRIVLSTSWVRMRRSLSNASRRLTPALQARVIGATYHKEMDARAFEDAPRGMQVWSDVLRRKPDAWLAVDDDDLHWPTWCRENLVHTDEILGISAPEVLAELQAKLAAMHEVHDG